MTVKTYLLAALLLILAPVPALPATGASPSIELPVQAFDRKGEIPRTFQASDLAVRVDGQPRAVTSLGPLPGPWRVVVYVDRVLTGSRTLRAAAGSLAERAPELANLGTVEVIVAEPQPTAVLAPTKDIRRVDEALSKLWLESDGRDDVRMLRQRFREDKTDEAGASERAAAAEEVEAGLVRRQQDALAEWLADQEGEGPRVLFLVADGYDVDPGKFYRGVSAETSGGSLEKTALETARTAAALGWIVIPLPMGDSTLPDLRRVKPKTTPQLPVGGTIRIGGKKPDENAPPPPPSLANPFEPLNWMAEASGGEVVLQAGGLTGVLNGLRNRFWAKIDAPRELDGRPRPVEVGTTRSDLTVRARRWDVAGVPEAVAASRAGRLVEGEEEGLGLEVSARIQNGTLDLRIESPEVPAGPLRVTLAGPEGQGATYYRLTDAERSAQEPNVYRLPVTLPEGAEVVGVLVESLAGGPWGGQTVSLAAAPAEAAPVSVAGPALRLVPPEGGQLSGKVRLRVNGAGEGVSRVEIRMGDRTAATCATVPCDAEVDLGRRVRPQVVQALAYDAAGQVVARDAVRLNDPNPAFGVKILEPASRRGVGLVDVAADVQAPAGRKVEKVEIYWNDVLAATLYAAPYRQRITVPRNRPEGYLKVTARLDDGSTAEDAMTLNASALGSEVDVRLVQLAVVVTDANGKPVPNLPREAFRLRQDGEDQEIAAFENAGELPLTLALAIDSSASMFIKLPDVNKAVTALLDTGLTPRDRALLIDFDTKPRLVRPVTRDLPSVAAALSQLQPDGGTALWEAVIFSLNQLRSISGRKALVIYSDGIDESERVPFAECLRTAREAGVPIYLIVSNPRAERGEDGGFLTEPSSVKFQRLAAAGGGQVYFIHPNQKLDEVYGQILSELRSQYTLAFYPKDSAPPAAWSKIEVEVPGRKGLTARTVTGLPGRK